MIRFRPVAAVLLLLVSGRAAASLELRFQDLTKPEAPGKFVTDATDCTQAQPPTGVLKLPHALTKNRTFALYYDPKLISPGQYGSYFDYTFYVERMGKNPPEWYACTPKLYPQGPFLDQSVEVHFTIDAGDATDNGAIDHVPIHSIAGRDFIDVTPTSNPAKVDLSQATGVEFTLHNLLPDQNLLVEPQVEAKARHPEYWIRLENAKLESSKDIIRIRPNETTTVRLRLEPKRLPALLATLTSAKPDSGHETMKVVLSYRSDVGGDNRVKPVDVVVRFVPSFISLFLALLLGSLVGTIAGQFLPKAWNGWYDMGQHAARGIVFSVIAELFAMLLVALGSKFVILQFDLDPWQVLPVFFIGLIVSGGKDLLAYIGLQQQRNAVAPGTDG